MLDLEHLKWAGLRTFANTSLHIRRSAWFSPNTQPDQLKTYPCCPNLYACRIFIPPGHDGRRTLPLVIRAHGGGFIMNAPAADDLIARHLADHANCIVVSIDYRKAPQNKFPAGYEDVVAQSLAIIDDPSLTIDRDRVVLCGSSAGGNLLLAAAQDPRLRSRVMGVAAIYPLVDMATDTAAKMATRPDPSIPDFIGEGFSGLGRLYLGTTDIPDLTDIRLSPSHFATRDSLPPHILLVGAEHDMFCHEAEAMADRLASLSGGEKVTTRFGWSAPGVQWHKVLGQPHAFDAFPVRDAEKEKARVTASDEMDIATSQWLVDTFSKEES